MIVKKISNTELYHHGIKGQKWGVRRYQNKDGSLTPEGRRRAAISAESVKKYSKKILSSTINSTITSVGKKAVKSTIALIGSMVAKDSLVSAGHSAVLAMTSVGAPILGISIAAIAVGVGAGAAIHYHNKKDNNNDSKKNK